jgi:hypothetical protein
MEPLSDMIRSRTKVCITIDMIDMMILDGDPYDP